MEYDHFHFRSVLDHFDTVITADPGGPGNILLSESGMNISSYSENFKRVLFLLILLFCTKNYGTMCVHVSTFAISFDHC